MKVPKMKTSSLTSYFERSFRAAFGLDQICRWVFISTVLSCVVLCSACSESEENVITSQTVQALQSLADQLKEIAAGEDVDEMVASIEGATRQLAELDTKWAAISNPDLDEVRSRLRAQRESFSVASQQIWRDIRRLSGSTLDFLGLPSVGDLEKYGAIGEATECWLFSPEVVDVCATDLIRQGMSLDDCNAIALRKDGSSMWSLGSGDMGYRYKQMNIWLRLRMPEDKTATGGYTVVEIRREPFSKAD
jgi:hypothetical protein